MTDNNNNNNNNDKFKCMYGLKIISFLLLVVMGIVFVFTVLLKTPEIYLSALLAISLIALLVALTFATYIFKCLGLARSEHSLGLPEGSIRALIALSLILIFMISSVFLYMQVSHPGRTGEIDFSQAEYDNLSKELVYHSHPYNATNETRYIVVLKTAENEESVDIAKQIITTISTLVIAIAGFYFGTKSVAVASKATTKDVEDIETAPDPLIRDVPIKNDLQGGNPIENFTIIGKNLDKIKEVKLVHKDTGTSIKCEDIQVNPKKITCTLKIPETAPSGPYNVIVVNTEQVEDCLEDAFTVEDKDLK